MKKIYFVPLPFICWNVSASTNFCLKNYLRSWAGQKFKKNNTKNHSKLHYIFFQKYWKLKGIPVFELSMGKLHILHKFHSWCRLGHCRGVDHLWWPEFRTGWSASWRVPPGHWCCLCDDDLRPDFVLILTPPSSFSWQSSWRRAGASLRGERAGLGD